MKNPPQEFASFIEAIESEGFQSWEIPLEEFGIVLNYRDGLDYCWLTEAPQNPKQWIAGFLRVDQLHRTREN